MSGRWRYILPNVITCISIVAALLAIAQAVGGNLDSAAWFVLLCVLLDKADGTVARFLRASSRFGLEMDSLSDLIAFGVAPAVLVLSLQVGKGIDASSLSSSKHLLIYGGCFVFVIAAALRLAKFNVLTDVYGKDFFFGIPTTVCGAFICSYYLTARKYNLPAIFFQALPGIMIALAALMVSRVPLPKVGRRKTLLMNVFTLINVFFVYLFGLLRIFPEYLLAVCAGYFVLGTAWALLKGIKPPRPASP